MNHESQPNYVRRLLALGVGIATPIGVVACGSHTESNSTKSSTADTSSEATSGNTEGTSAVSDTDETTTTMTPELYSEVKDLFTVNQADLSFECVDEGAQSNAIVVKSLTGKDSVMKFVIPKNNFALPVDIAKPDDDHRMWSDALAPSVTADVKDKDAVLLNIEANGCEDVLSTYANLNFLARLPLPGGIKVADINPAFKKFDVDPSQINDMASETINRIANMSDQADLDTYKQFILDAQLFAGVMHNFENAGVQKAIPTSYFHLKNLGLDDNEAGVPEVEVVNGTYGDDPRTSVVEDEFLVMRGTTKANGCVVEWGINFNDMRLATLKDKDCAPVVTTTTTTPGHETTTTQPHGSTTMPKKKPQTPTGEDTVVTTIEAPVSGSSTPTTSQSPNTTAPVTGTTIKDPGQSGTTEEGTVSSTTPIGNGEY
jgi:hypothetical protein